MENERTSNPSTEKSSNVDVLLIDKIIQKSREQKITWSKSAQRFEGQAVNGSMRIVIDRQSAPIFGSTWRSFVVSRSGVELLKLENEPFGMAALAGLTDTPAHKKVSELLAWLDSARQRQVKAAISELDEL